MNRLLLIYFTFLSLSTITYGQNCPYFDDLMNRATSYWSVGDFKNAFNQLSAAKEYCPEYAAKVDAQLVKFTNEITKKYEEIEQKNKLIEEQVKIAQIERDNARRKEIEADSAKKVSDILFMAEQKATQKADSVLYELRKLRNLDIAKNIAIQSTNIDNSQKEVKIELAKKSYEIFKNYNQTDISELYSCIYFAFCSLNEKRRVFNVVKPTKDVPIINIEKYKKDCIRILDINGSETEWLIRLPDSIFFTPDEIREHRAVVYYPKKSLLGFSYYDIEIRPYIKNQHDSVFSLVKENKVTFKERYNYVNKLILNTPTLNQEAVSYIKNNENIKDEWDKISSILHDSTSNISVIGMTTGKVFFLKHNPDKTIHEVKVEILKHSGVISKIIYEKHKNKWIISSYDGVVSIWKGEHIFNESYQPLVLPNHRSWVTSIFYDVEEDRLYTSCNDGSIYIWPMDVEKMYQYLISHPLQTNKVIEVNNVLKPIYNNLNKTYDSQKI